MITNLFIPSDGGPMLNAIHQSGGENVAPLALMMHGFPGNKTAHGDFYAEIEYALESDGIDTLRFDFRGCGQSEGKVEDFSLATAGDDLEAVLSWARIQGYRNFFYIAEGMGAPVALMNLRPNLRALAFLWPALDPRHTATIRKALASGEEIIGQALRDELKAYNPTLSVRDIGLPLLAQHGEADREIPPVQIELLRRHAVSDKRIEITTYENGTHGLPDPKHRRASIHHLSHFLRRHVPAVMQE